MSKTPGSDWFKNTAKKHGVTKKSYKQGSKLKQKELRKYDQTKHEKLYKQDAKAIDKDKGKERSILYIKKRAKGLVPRKVRVRGYTRVIWVKKWSGDKKSRKRKRK
jgi:hypothetical protein